jgi:hypothetical protein
MARPSLTGWPSEGAGAAQLAATKLNGSDRQSNAEWDLCSPAGSKAQNKNYDWRFTPATWQAATAGIKVSHAR